MEMNGPIDATARSSKQDRACNLQGSGKSLVSALFVFRPVQQYAAACWRLDS